MTQTDLVYTVFIKTTPEELWKAITHPEFCRQYWGGHANISDWKVGSDWEHHDTNDQNAVRVTGKVLESSPPRRLVISWFSPGEQTDVSKVTFEIESVANLVRLDVTHNEFRDHSAMAGNVAKGWPVVLSSMKSFLETGDGLDMMAILKGDCSSVLQNR